MKKDNSPKNAAKSVQNYIEKGKKLCDQENYGDAISAFDAAIRLEPNNRDAHNNRGNAKYF